jgi:hypothetical protein
MKPELRTQIDESRRQLRAYLERNKRIIGSLWAFDFVLFVALASEVFPLIEPRWWMAIPFVILIPTYVTTYRRYFPPEGTTNEDVLRDYEYQLTFLIWLKRILVGGFLVLVSALVFLGRRG